MNDCLLLVEVINNENHFWQPLAAFETLKDAELFRDSIADEPYSYKRFGDSAEFIIQGIPYYEEGEYK